MCHVRAEPPVCSYVECLFLLASHISTCIKLTCAVENRVDELLFGGLREGHLTEFYGEPACGNTQVTYGVTIYHICYIACIKLQL